MNRNLATGVALLSGLLLAIPTSPLSAAAQEQTELTSNIAAKAEATVVAKQLDNDDFGSAGPDVASYEARFSDEGESDDNLVARFPLPNGCAPGGAGVDLSCEIGDVSIQPVVLNMAGETIYHETSITRTEIEVVAKPEGSSPAGHVITMYVAPHSDTSALASAAEAFTWMVAADAKATGGAQPLNGEEEGLWFEENSDAQAGPDEIDGEWVPSAGEFENPPAISPVGPLDPYGSFKRPKQVKVPSNYVHCSVWLTSKCKPKNLHDYCSWSPDSFGYTVPRAGTIKTSFRGPCARHDLSVDSIRKKKISVSKKRSQRANADKTFKSHLRQNCGYGLYMTTKGRTKCYDRAATYYSVVSGKTEKWDGK